MPSSASSPPTPPAARPATARERLTQVALVWTVIAGIVAMAGMILGRLPQGWPERLFLWRQDLPVLAAATALIWAIALAPTRLWPKWLTAPLYRPSTIWWAAGVVLVAGVVGAGLVFEHFRLSLDEAMADFDAAIFAHGKPMAPIPADWRPFVEALQPSFGLYADGHWSSAYLPVNAAVRALGQLAHISDWINPLITAAGVIATWAVGRQLWPEHPRRAIAAAVLLAASPQVVINGMTAYAVPLHLALNMAWLWLFLRNRPLSDLAAIVVGFFAVGIHQLLFHPLFVGFFVLDLWLTRRWTRAAIFTGAYAAICLFWVLYPQLVFHLVGIRPDEVAAAGASSFVDRIRTELDKVSFDNFGRFADNMVRFVAWQAPVLLPLAGAGILSLWRRAGPLRAMALGMLATGVAMAILVPSQTHGWGYRYFHGFLGGLALMAVQGWVAMSDRLPDDERERFGRGLALVTLVAAIAFVPLRALQAYQFSHPFAASMAVIQASPAEVVLVDNGPLGFDTGTLIRNDPFLTNRPKVMLLGELTRPQLDQICRRGKVWVFDARHPAAAGMLTYENTQWGPDMARRRAYLQSIGCVG